MKLIGTDIANQIKSELKNMTAEGELAIVQVGDDPVSSLYVRKKQEFAKDVNVQTKIIKTTEIDLKNELLKLNEAKNIKGIIVQLPLPLSIQREDVLSLIDKQKDVDGFRYIIGKDFITYPPTILSIFEIMKHYHLPIEDGVLIVGGGFLVGRPLKKFLEEQGIKVEILQKNDSEYDDKLKKYNIVVVATGGGRLFRQSDFKEGSYVIDASTVAEERKIRGDVETGQNEINLSPVPGGVGPITVAMLFRNFFNL